MELQYIAQAESCAYSAYSSERTWVDPSRTIRIDGSVFVGVFGRLTYIETTDINRTVARTCMRSLSR